MTLERTADWSINGYDVNVFEIETNYIARIFEGDEFRGIRVYKKDWMHPLRWVYFSLNMELA